MAENAKFWEGRIRDRYLNNSENDRYNDGWIEWNADKQGLEIYYYDNQGGQGELQVRTSDFQPYYFIV